MKKRSTSPFVTNNSLPVQNTLTSPVSYCTNYDASWGVSTIPLALQAQDVQ